MTRNDPPPQGGDPLSDPRKRDPGTADDEFARFREEQLAKRRQTQRNAKQKPDEALTAQERARREILKLESGPRTRSQAASRAALERARQELRNKETRQATRKPTTQLSREAMLRGRAEVQEREREVGVRPATGRVSREVMERAKRERQALDDAEAVRTGRRPPRRDPASDPAVRPTNASDEEFEKFRRVQLRKKRLEALGLDKNPDLKPDESHGAFFGTTPVERQHIRGATKSFRAEELEDLAEHQDELVADLRQREVEGTIDEIPDPPAPAPAPDDWLEGME